MEKFGFRIMEIMGAGTFGTVYKCIDEQRNVRCVKRIKLSSTAEMIQQEIYLMQNLTHPRIIGLYGYFCSDDYKYINIVMEHATFGSLSNIIAIKCTEDRFFGEGKIKQFLIDMLLGIEYLHMKNVVHKDLKPCNILVCHNHRLKIADFGVSKITNIESCDFNEMLKRDKAKEAGGSPIYMAPETLIHNHFTFSSDIWAMGCILYELCTLHATFDFVESMDDLIRCILTKNYPPIDTALYPYSNQLVSLCDDMMRVEVPKRATIKHIISNPLILVDYYHSYFRFDA